MKDRVLSLIFLVLLLFSNNLSAKTDAEARRRFTLYYEGRDLYQSQCLPCHGERGRGDGPWAEGWTQHRPRNFRDGIFKFRSTPIGYLPTEEDLKRTISRGISGTQMPRFEGALSSRQLEAVIIYVQSFSRKWKDDTLKVESIEIPTSPQWDDERKSFEQHLKSGETLFKTHCATCHGDRAKGDGPASKALKDHWGFDILPADLTADYLKSGNTSADIYRTIALGLDGTPMIGFREALTEDQIWEIISYLDTLKK